MDPGWRRLRLDTLAGARYPGPLEPARDATMSSFTQMTKRKRARRKKNAGSDRKRKQSAASTLSHEALFAACGEPGKPAPKKQPGK